MYAGGGEGGGGGRRMSRGGEWEGEGGRVGKRGDGRGRRGEEEKGGGEEGGGGGGMIERCKTTHPTSQKRMAPSEPPLANSFSWTGCQETATVRETDKLDNWEERKMHPKLNSMELAYC